MTPSGRTVLEQPRPVSGIAKTRYASAVGYGFTQVKALSIPGLPGQKSIAFSGLTIRSSRARFAVSSRSHSPDAGRLNSGVSAQKKQISAKSFLDKRHKSFSDPLSPALRHISDLIHLRAVSDLLAPGNLSHPRHRANSQLQRANNSFKPTPARCFVELSSLI